MKKINVKHDLGNRLYGGLHNIEGAHLHHVGIAIRTSTLWASRKTAHAILVHQLHLPYFFIYL